MDFAFEALRAFRDNGHLRAPAAIEESRLRGSCFRGLTARDILGSPPLGARALRRWEGTVEFPALASAALTKGRP